MTPRPKSVKPEPLYKLNGKTAIITGGDSGIGKAVALLFAKEGANVAISYLPSEEKDAQEVRRLVEEEFGGTCLMFAGDIRKESFCARIVTRTAKKFGRIDVLVNNAAMQVEQQRIEKITAAQLRATFETNIFHMFYMARFAVPYMKKGACIINTTSVTAYRGSAHLIDYSSTKGAIVTFTRSLAANLAAKGIRVNGVAPGPIWTPLIVSSFRGKQVAEFGTDVPLGRAGEPAEVAPCYLFLACEDSSYMTGQILHPNGGEIVNG